MLDRHIKHQFTFLLVLVFFAFLLLSFAHGVVDHPHAYGEPVTVVELLSEQPYSLATFGVLVVTWLGILVIFSSARSTQCVPRCLVREGDVTRLFRRGILHAKYH